MLLSVIWFKRGNIFLQAYVPKCLAVSEGVIKFVINSVIKN